MNAKRSQSSSVSSSQPFPQPSLFAVGVLCLLFLTGCSKDVAKTAATSDARTNAQAKPVSPIDPTEISTTKTPEIVLPQEFVEVDMGPVLPPMMVPKDNPMTPEKIELGEMLFFDTALSVDHSMSCATCHDPELGWGDGEKIAEGAGGVRGKRNTLSILNVGFYDQHLFWDGRVKTLEEQALVPVFEKTEMGMESEEELLNRISENEDYQNRFAAAFEDGLTTTNIARALASFQRTIYVKEVPYDRYLAGDKTAMSESAIRGSKVFFNKRVANCVACHPAPLFTDHMAYNIGIGMDQENPDWGFHYTKGWAHWGKFRSPSLRGISQTGPYMHDGSLETLEDVVAYYNKGGTKHQYTDVAVANLRLTRLSSQQEKDLVAFMREGLREIKEDED